MLFSFQKRKIQYNYFIYSFYTKLLIVFGVREIFVSMHYEIKLYPGMTLKILTFLCLFILYKPVQVSCQPPLLGTEIFGKASYYENKLYGRRTASGETLAKTELTCAHPTLPFGTMIEVTNLVNNKWCIVRVNDRGPFAKGRILDLTHAAAKRLSMFGHGVVKVKVTVVGEQNTIYIEREDNLVKNSTEFLEEAVEENEIPLRPKAKILKKKPSKAMLKKRAVRRKTK